jgi:hypothetical protein
MWDFDEDDAFVPMTFSGSSTTFALFGDDAFAQPAPEFPFQTRSHPQLAQISRPSEAQHDAQGLADENNALRQKELTMRATYTERLMQNERLKRQLEECRSRFMSAFYSGINSHRS